MNPSRLDMDEMSGFGAFKFLYSPSRNYLRKYAISRRAFTARRSGLSHRLVLNTFGQTALRIPLQGSSWPVHESCPAVGCSGFEKLHLLSLRVAAFTTFLMSTFFLQHTGRRDCAFSG